MQYIAVKIECSLFLKMSHWIAFTPFNQKVRQWLCDAMKYGKSYGALWFALACCLIDTYTQVL